MSPGVAACALLPGLQAARPHQLLRHRVPGKMRSYLLRPAISLASRVSLLSMTS